MIRSHTIRLLACFGAILTGALGHASDEHKSTVTANSALVSLVRGNLRFEKSQAIRPDQTAARRLEVSKGQHPLAIVLTCSDSRVPPELIFDQGLGDLFVVRTAGNVVDDIVLGSIEYAAEHLGAPLIVVMGHESCGAVKAAVAGQPTHDHIDAIIKEIAPAVKSAHPGADMVHQVVEENVRLTVERLKNSGPALKDMVEKGHLKVVGAIYDLKTGNTTFLDHVIVVEAPSTIKPAAHAAPHHTSAPAHGHASVTHAAKPKHVVAKHAVAKHHVSKKHKSHHVAKRHGRKVVGHPYKVAAHTGH